MESVYDVSRILMTFRSDNPIAANLRFHEIHGILLA